MKPAPWTGLAVWVVAMAAGGCAGGDLLSADVGPAVPPLGDTGDDQGVVVGPFDLPGPSPTGDAGRDARPGALDAAGDADTHDGASPPVPDAPLPPPTQPPGDADADGDGAEPPEDCDDADLLRYPGAVETRDDGIDTNCDGQDNLPCVHNSDCPPAWYCAADFTCRAGCRSDDCREGLRCHSTERVCLPADLSCGRDADCPDGTFCRVYFDARTNALGTSCERIEGDAPAGALCDADAQCASGACFQGERCLGLCVDDGDCPADTACAWSRFNAGEVENRVRICMGQLQPCTRLSDCGAGQTCLWVPRPDQPRGFLLACRPAPEGVGPGGAGAPCVDDVDCRTGICLGEGICFAPCGGDADCPQGDRCYAARLFAIDDGGTAHEADDVYLGMPVCGPDDGSDQPCDALRRCPAGESCRPRLGPDGRAFETHCFDNEGPGAPGVACDAAADCQLGSCLERHCVGLCWADADCADGTTCASGRYTLDDRGTADPYDDLTGDLGFCRP